MTTDEPGSEASRAKSFGAVAARVRRGPADVSGRSADLDPGSGRLQILDLGAGTGKLSAVAAALGHDVVAVDPSQEMLAMCSRLPASSRWSAPAESIPLAHASVDAVIVGQAFHWFDHARALPEIARVLRPNGVLGLLWNNADKVVPWVRRLDRAMHGRRLPVRQGDQFDPMPILLQSDLFSMVETARFRHWHDLDRAGPAAAGPVALAGRGDDRIPPRGRAGADQRHLREHGPTARAAADAVFHQLLPHPAQRSGQLPPRPGRSGRAATVRCRSTCTVTLVAQCKPDRVTCSRGRLSRGVTAWTRKRCASGTSRAYEAVHEAADFTELKRRYQNFVVPWTIAFMAWYLAVHRLQQLGPRLHEPRRWSGTSTWR